MSRRTREQIEAEIADLRESIEEAESEILDLEEELEESEEDEMEPCLARIIEVAVRTHDTLECLCDWASGRKPGPCELCDAIAACPANWLPDGAGVVVPQPQHKGALKGKA